MEGRIKFVDPKTQKWGFIVPADKTRDVHFDIADFAGPRPSPADNDAPVQFDLAEHGTWGYPEFGAAEPAAERARRLLDAPEPSPQAA